MMMVSHGFQDKILNFLKKKNKWVSTTEVSYAIKRHYYEVRSALSELYKDGLVARQKTPTGVYWRIRRNKPPTKRGGSPEPSPQKTPIKQVI